MLRTALCAAVFSLVACGGSTDSVNTASSSLPCTEDVCGTPGTAMTVTLAAFDHATDVLEVAVGAHRVELMIDRSTQPLLAEPCESGPLSALIATWNATAPMNPFGQFDLLDDRNGTIGPYHRLIVALAKAGATATITVAPDMETVETFEPVCPATS